MSNLLIVICTKAKTIDEFSQRPIFPSLQKHCDNNSSINFHLFTDNQKGLSHCYNEILKDSKHVDSTVLFVHDDVELNDLFLYEKLTNSPYSITGIAGTKTLDKTVDKVAWNLASKRED